MREELAGDDGGEVAVLPDTRMLCNLVQADI